MIPEKYNDVGYYIENDQLVVYKDRERFSIDSTVGYAGIYDFNSWDVPIIQEPEELITKLKELDVKGRKIEAIKCIGLCYNLTEDSIENAACTYYKENGSKDFEIKSHYKNIPLDTPYIRYVEIDEPIIIYLDNGEVEIYEGSDKSTILWKDLKKGIKN